jgi:pimeloyl-ACP methyl ester carboxylesterase
MASFILVHGGMHGGWCWDKVLPLLQAAGQVAIAPDLPGVREGTIPPQDVTLALTGGFIADLARRSGEKVVMVGHSLGGITISEAAERAPEAVLGLVYVAAILLPDGAAVIGNLVGGDETSNLVRASAGGAALIADPNVARDRFYNGCAEHDAQSALARLVPQPTRPMRDRLRLTSSRFGAVPRAYIECLQDNAHPLCLQRSQQAKLPCDPVFKMATGHSPFLQAPEALAHHLIAAAAAFERGRASVKSTK